MAEYYCTVDRGIKENTKKMSDYEKQRFHSYYDTPEFQKKLIGTRGLKERTLFDIVVGMISVLLWPFANLFVDISNFSTLFLLHPFVAIGIILLIIAGILLIAVFHLPAVGIICIAAPFVSDIIVCIIRDFKKHFNDEFPKKTEADYEISKRLYDRTDEHLDLEFKYYLLREDLLDRLRLCFDEELKMKVCTGASIYHHLVLHDVDIPRWAPHYTGFTDEFSITPKYVTATTPEELKAEYKTLMKKYHPDNHPDDENAHAVFEEMKEEYECYMAFFEGAEYRRLAEKNDGRWHCPGKNTVDGCYSAAYVNIRFLEDAREMFPDYMNNRADAFDPYDKHSKGYNEEIYEAINPFHVDFTGVYSAFEYMQ